ncbi:hypothetical protein FRC11_004731 [Ceratobasidium sp. 423]|nr:hypothetical protein FRC11_004731 [Ceratobasidium sp. 423]
MGLVVDSPEVCIRHGRQFHGSGSNYGLHNDEREFAIGRLNDQFQALKLIVGSNYTAPLPELNFGQGPKDILDVASGSGIWVIEIAREFPQARVVGMDMRGIIQLVEPSPAVSRTGYYPPALDKAERALARCGHVPKDANEASLDKDERPESWSMGSQIAPAIRGAPSMWANVHEEEIRVPIGAWASDEAGQKAGQLMHRQTVELYHGFRPNLIDIGGMTGDEVDGIIASVADELEGGLKWQLEALFDFVWAVKAQHDSHH